MATQASNVPVSVRTSRYTDFVLAIGVVSIIMVLVLPVYGLLRQGRRHGRHRSRPVTRWWRDSKALKAIALAALLGPTLGVWFSQVAVAETHAGEPLHKRLR